MIDTHKFVTDLEKTGFTKQQAETIAGVAKDLQDTAELVTKKDLELALARELAPIGETLRLHTWALNIMVGGIVALVLKAFFL